MRFILLLIFGDKCLHCKKKDFIWKFKKWVTATPCSSFPICEDCDLKGTY